MKNWALVALAAFLPRRPAPGLLGDDVEVDRRRPRTLVEDFIMVHCRPVGKKNGGGYFEDVSYCRRKSSMQCYVGFSEDECNSWNDDYVWCPKDNNICDGYPSCTTCLYWPDQSYCSQDDPSWDHTTKAECESDYWGKDYVWCGN